MQELKYTFTQQELEELGFNMCTDGDFSYMLYLFNKDDYWGSKFLSTETDTLLSVDWMVDSLFKKGIEFRVVSPLGDEAEPFLEKQQLIDIVNKGDF